MEFKIREAELKDLDAIMDMYRSLIDYHKDFGPIHEVKPEHFGFRRAYYETLTRENSNEMGIGFILVAESGGKPVGMVVAQYIDSPDAHMYEKQVFIQDAFVFPEYRRKLAATTLARRAVEKSIDDGREMAYLWVAPENTHVQRETEKMGFSLAFKFNALKLSEYKNKK